MNLSNLKTLDSGGNIGLMGAVAEAVQAGGQSVIGVMPKALQPREVRWLERCGEGGDRKRVCTRERKNCGTAREK